MSLPRCEDWRVVGQINSVRLDEADQVEKVDLDDANCWELNPE
jgi:hypothetical protein